MGRRRRPRNCSRGPPRRLAERLSRLVQRKALRIAGDWEGPLSDLQSSINLLPQDLARAGYDRWLLEEIDAAGHRPERITVEITESALLVDQRAIADAPGAPAGGGSARSRSTISAPAMPASPISPAFRSTC